MRLSNSKDFPEDSGEAIDREEHPSYEGSLERSSFNERSNSPPPCSPTSADFPTSGSEEIMGADGRDYASYDVIVNSSLYPTPPPPPAPGTTTTLSTILEDVPMSGPGKEVGADRGDLASYDVTVNSRSCLAPPPPLAPGTTIPLATITEDVQMSTVVQEQGAAEMCTGANGKGARRNSKDTMAPNSSPEKGKAIDKQAHWFYDGIGDWSEVRASRDTPVRPSTVVEDASLFYINQEYIDGEVGDDGQEIWQECWATDRVVERPKDQSAMRECTWEPLTEQTPLTISNLQLRMLEFKRRVAEIDMDDKDYAQSQAIMKEAKTEAMLFQIRVQDLNHHIASVRFLNANFVVSWP
jgi:hypothetical protein